VGKVVSCFMQESGGGEHSEVPDDKGTSLLVVLKWGM